MAASLTTRPSEVRAYIESLFPNKRPVLGRGWNSGMAGEIATLLVLVDSLDSRLLAEWLGRDRLIQYEQARTTLRHQLNRREGGDQTKMGANPAVDIYELLAGCPDQPTPTASTHLHFIADPELRLSIARDVDSVKALVALEEWRAATVLAGAVVEAMLLAKLGERAQDAMDFAASKGWPARVLDKWSLEWLIQTAGGLAVITNEEAKACSLAQHYRNLIHPGRERLAHPCNRGTTLVAQAAIELLLEKWA